MDPKLLYLATTLAFIPPPWRKGSHGMISVKHFRVCQSSMDAQDTKWHRNMAENFNRLRRVHERYRRQTDRQTDRWAIAYRTSTWVYTFAKMICPNFTKFLYMLPVAVTRPHLKDTLCTSGFVDDVIFSYNGGNRPESKTTGMFRLVHQMAVYISRTSDNVAWSRSPAGGTGAKFAVSNCILS